MVVEVEITDRQGKPWIEREHGVLTSRDRESATFFPTSCVTPSMALKSERQSSTVPQLMCDSANHAHCSRQIVLKTRDCHPGTIVRCPNRVSEMTIVLTIDLPAI